MKLFSTLLCLLAFAFSTQAQIVDKTKDKAKNKTNRRIDNKIDKGLDKGLDGIEGLFKKKNKDKDKDNAEQEELSKEEQEAQNAAAMSMMGFGSAADVKEKYSFDHELEYKITTTEKKGKDTQNMNMIMMFSEKDPLFGSKMQLPEGASSSIYDYEKGQMITLTQTQGMNMGMVMNIDQEAVAEYTAEESDKEPDYSLEKTGNTKDILGYKCEEWKMEDDENTSLIWLTNDLDINIGRAFSSMAAASKGKSNMPGADYPSGTMMEVTSTEKKSGDIYHMVATRVDMNSNSSVSTEGYQFMNMGGGK